MRTLNDEVLYAWMINHIYDGSKELRKSDRIQAYQVMAIHSFPHSRTHSLTHSLTHSFTQPHS